MSYMVPTNPAPRWPTCRSESCSLSRFLKQAQGMVRSSLQPCFYFQPILKKDEIMAIGQWQCMILQPFKGVRTQALKGKTGPNTKGVARAGVGSPQIDEIHFKGSAAFHPDLSTGMSGINGLEHMRVQVALRTNHSQPR